MLIVSNLKEERERERERELSFLCYPQLLSGCSPASLSLPPWQQC